MRFGFRPADEAVRSISPYRGWKLVPVLVVGEMVSAAWLWLKLVFVVMLDLSDFALKLLSDPDGVAIDESVPIISGIDDMPAGNGGFSSLLTSRFDNGLIRVCCPEPSFLGRL